MASSGDDQEEWQLLLACWRGEFSGVDLYLERHAVGEMVTSSLTIGSDADVSRAMHAMGMLTSRHLGQRQFAQIDALAVSVVAVLPTVSVWNPVRINLVRALAETLTRFSATVEQHENWDQPLSRLVSFCLDLPSEV
jgi:hypothetical protein